MLYFRAHETMFWRNKTKGYFEKTVSSFSGFFSVLLHVVKSVKNEGDNSAYTLSSMGMVYMRSTEHKVQRIISVFQNFQMAN